MKSFFAKKFFFIPESAIFAAASEKMIFEAKKIEKNEHWMNLFPMKMGLVLRSKWLRGSIG